VPQFYRARARATVERRVDYPQRVESGESGIGSCAGPTRRVGVLVQFAIVVLAALLEWQLILQREIRH